MLFPYKKLLFALTISCIFFINNYGMNENNLYLSDFESLLPELILKIVSCCEPKEKNRLKNTSMFIHGLLKQHKHKDIIIETDPWTIHHDDRVKALFESIRHNKYSLVKSLLKSASIPGIHELKNILGITPIYYALENKNIIMTNLLKKYKCNINQTTPSIHAIHHAAYNCDTHSMKFLLNAKTNPNILIKKIITPLHIAVHQGHTAIVKLLVNNSKTDINKKNKLQETPLHVALKKGYLAIAEILINANAQVDEKNLIDQTPLHIASKKEYIDCMKLLLAKKANINAKDNRGYTALHIAASEGYDDAVQLLLQEGAHIDEKDKNEKTPLDFAILRKHNEVVEILKRHK